MNIDAHLHVWNLERASYPWLRQQFSAINRSMLFDEIRPSLGAAGFQATVLVQAADNDSDTDYMLEVARDNPEVVGVVAYVPLDRPDRAERRLEQLQRDPLVIGVRNLIHDLPDPDWLLRPEVDEGLSLVEAAGLTLDVVSVLPRHLEHVPTLVERHPSIMLVLDHLSHPPIGGDTREPWWTLIERASVHPNVYAKVSGLYSTVGDLSDWSVETVRPHFERALNLFGADRLMYGGDWPISVLAGGYERVWQGLSSLFDELDESERRAVLGGTAQKFYGIERALLERAGASV
ncbi:amidohydrolase family protein [Arthrobacter tecti]